MINETLPAGYKVTPLAGVWIEIPLRLRSGTTMIVTPLAGVWIEIYLLQNHLRGAVVTPLAGVWIEIVR